MVAGFRLAGFCCGWFVCHARTAIDEISRVILMFDGRRALMYIFFSARSIPACHLGGLGVLSGALSTETALRSMSGRTEKCDRRSAGQEIVSSFMIMLGLQGRRSIQ
jgi:hypothetical protein